MRNFRRTPLYAESWNVAIRKKNKGTILIDLNSQFKVLKNNFDSWIADPFIFDYKGITYIFAEMYDYKKRRGTLCYGIVEDENVTKWKQIIVEDYHLSYPFIFEYKENIYILPESSASHSLYLYKAIEFPDKWEKVIVLQDNVKWVDTTLFTYNDKYYAFTTDVKDYENQQEYLLSFDNDGGFICENINVADFKTSRMGGHLLNIEDKLIKVCQDCRKTYGGGLIFKEITFNDLDGKVLQHVSSKNINLNENILIDGIHTYNANDKYEIVDIKTRRFNILNFIFRILNKVRG